MLESLHNKKTEEEILGKVQAGKENNGCSDERGGW